MIQRVTMEGIELPRLYIAENKKDVDQCIANGVPFIRWSLGKEELIRQLLRPTLVKMFPHIKWNKVLGPIKSFKSDVQYVKGNIIDTIVEPVSYDQQAMLDAQYEYDTKYLNGEFDNDYQSDDDQSEYVGIAKDKREHDNGTEGNYNDFYRSASIADYVGDLSSSVDINVLQELSLLPKFIGDIADCIRTNFSTTMRWTEGYNKKLDSTVGKFHHQQQLPNLIILDISSSIPRGIAATMCSLIDTMRTTCNAELIITASRSGYYSMDDELPSPQTIRDYYKPAQEAREFVTILNNYVAGREWGHVISFGDNDSPSKVFHWDYDSHMRDNYFKDMANTKIHEVHSYHTCENRLTGYVEWIPKVCPNVNQTFDTSWCNVMEKN